MAPSSELKIVESLNTFLGDPLSLCQWYLASLPVRLGRTKPHDHGYILHGAHITSFVLISTAAADFGRLRMVVTRGDMTALDSLLPTSNNLVFVPRGKLSVGVPPSASLEADRLFDSWVRQH